MVGVVMGSRDRDMWQGRMQKMEVGVVDRTGPLSSVLGVPDAVSHPPPSLSLSSLLLSLTLKQIPGPGSLSGAT